MDKIVKQLEDIKGAVDLMLKLGSINSAAHKTLIEALDETLTMYRFSSVKYEPNKRCPYCFGDDVKPI